MLDNAGRAMRINAGFDGLARVLELERRRAEKAFKSAMTDATGGLKEDLRRQVEAAGLGPRLARTWQAMVYPQSRDSLGAAGYVYSKAPAIISAFATGATITPVFMNFLAIPTSNVPRRGRKRMTPRQVEREFGELQIRQGRNGTFLGFVDLIAGKSRTRRTVRPVTKRRLAQGRRPTLTLMFIFVRRTRMPKLFDLQATADRWGAQVPALFDARMGRE